MKMPSLLLASIMSHNKLRILLYVAALTLVFGVYTWGISNNPPGFYLDESANAYNAYLVSRTGAGEFGPPFPLLFREFALNDPTYIHPLSIYSLAIVFRFIHPSIAVARTVAALWMFAACLLLGLLAKRISGQRKIGVIVAGTALLTPWLFETSRLAWEPHCSALTIVVFLLATYELQSKKNWTWRDTAMVSGSLGLVTYGYASGRVLAPLFALGLLLFANTKRRFAGVIQIWLGYGVTLLPLILFNRSHPGVLTKRLYEVSYIRPDASWKQIAASAFEFVRRYLQDQSLTTLLVTGDYHPRHHVQGSGGAIFFATLVLVMISLWLIIAHGGWRKPWWRFVLYGLAISIIPGVITNEPFHQLRLMAYAIFLLLLTIPALEWLFAPIKPRENEEGHPNKGQSGKYDSPVGLYQGVPRPFKLAFLGLLIAATIAQAADFLVTFHRQGRERINEFDVAYKAAYDAAVAQPQRPIYLENGMWGPAYMDAYWYATIEGRPTSEFSRLGEGARPPSGAIVLSSNSDCRNCQPIKKSGCYLLYKAQ